MYREVASKDIFWETHLLKPQTHKLRNSIISLVFLQASETLCRIPGKQTFWCLFQIYDFSQYYLL